MAFGPEYRCEGAQLTFGEARVAELAAAPAIDAESKQWLHPSLQSLLAQPNALFDYLDGNESISWAIKTKGKVAGLAIIHTASDYIPYMRTLVYPEFQGQGIGQASHLVRLRHWLTELGEEALSSYTYTDNNRVSHLLKKAGYYHFEDYMDENSGRPYQGFRAVNPNNWEIFHAHEPSANATPETFTTLVRTLEAAENQVKLL